MVRVSAVEPLRGFHVRIAFTDGTERVIDIKPYLWGPVFEPLRTDPALFREVRVDTELGTIVWPNGADIDPDVLHGDAQPEWMGDRIAANVSGSDRRAALLADRGRTADARSSVADDAIVGAATGIAKWPTRCAD